MTDRLLRFGGLGWSDLYLLAEQRTVVRWESGFLTNPFQRQEDGSYAAAWPAKSSYRGLCLEGAEPHAIFEPR